MRLKWKKDWTFILILFITLRLILSVLGIVKASGPEPEPLASGSIYAASDLLLLPDHLSHIFVNVWLRWDTAWYLKIAAFGYSLSDGTTSFNPLYPTLVGLLGRLTGNYLLSALLLSNLACLAALILLYEVAMIEGLGKKQATHTVLSFLLFPSAFFMFVGYTDSLYLALILGVWITVRRQNWLLAGFLGALATLTRLQGSLLTPVLAWAWLACLPEKKFAANQPWAKVKAVLTLFKDRTGRKKIYLTLCKPKWIGILLPALAFGSWTLVLRLNRAPSIPDSLTNYWGIRTVAPWTGIWLFFQRLFTRPRVFIDYIDLLVLIIILVLLVIGLHHLDPSLLLYVLLTLALFFMRGTPPHLLDSFSRYMLSIFPAFLVLGSIRSRFLRVFIWALSFSVQVFLILGFLDWRWIA